MAGDDVIERGEILVKKTDQRRGLGSFGQQREAFEIGEQNCRRADIFRRHLAVLLELVGDCRRQQGVEQFFGTSLLGGDFDPRLIEFLDRAIMLEQLSAQFELRQHLARQAQRFDLFEAPLAGLDP